jgi:cobalt-zinc-cadmium efflux system outer membrane protein
MKRFFILLTLAGNVCGEALTPDQLARQALSGNPELRFYEEQVAALPKPAKVPVPEILQPLDFPSQTELRRAVLNLDRDMARLYLAEFRYVLESEVRLGAVEYQSAVETAATAADIAHRIGALVKMLEERPAAGVEALIERRILEGAALPFIREAAEAKVRAEYLRTRLNGLLGREAGKSLEISGGLGLPAQKEVDAVERPLLLKIREAEIARGLAGGGAAAEIEAFAVGGWFTREGLGANDAMPGMTRPGATYGAAPDKTRERLSDDARRKWTREQVQRRAALAAAKEVVEAIPPTLVQNLQAAADLAERQYRVGALGVNLLVEIHREYLDALQSRNASILQAWRNALDLAFLDLPADEAPPKGKITVKPVN